MQRATDTVYDPSRNHSCRYIKAEPQLVDGFEGGDDVDDDVSEEGDWLDAPIDESLVESQMLDEENSSEDSGGLTCLRNI